MKAARLFLFVAQLAIFAAPVLAADKEWTGGGDGTLWSDDDNWDPNGAPGSTDVVTIENSEVRVDKSAEAQSLTTLGGSLEVAAPLAIGSESFIENLVLKHDLTNQAKLTIEGDSAWNEGFLLGGGDVIVQDSLAVSGGVTREVIGKTLKNQGTLSVGRSIRFGNATLENSSVLTLSNSSLLQKSNTTSLFKNSGTLEVVTVLSLFTVNGSIFMPFRNEGGTVSAKGSDGTRLEFHSSSTFQGGNLSVGNDATIRFLGSDHSFSGVTATGQGTVDWNQDIQLSGDFTNQLSGVLSTARGLLIARNVTGPGKLINSGRATWSGGTTLTLSNAGGVLNTASDDDPSDDEIRGANVFHITGGRLGTTFENQGDVRHEGTSLTVLDGATFHNRVQGRYTLAASIAGEGTFSNQGQLLVAKAGQFNITANFQLNDGGVVSMQPPPNETGEIRFGGSGVSSGGGNFVTGPQGVIYFNDGQPEFRGGYHASGAGSFQLASGVNFKIAEGGFLQNDLSSGDAFRIDGNLEIAGELRNRGAMHWIGKTIATTGVGKVSNNTTFHIHTGNSHVLQGDGGESADFVNVGTVQQDKVLKLKNALVENNSTWNLNGAPITSEGASSFTVNSGTLNIRDNSTTIDAPLNMRNKSKLNIFGEIGLELRGGGTFSGGASLNQGVSSSQDPPMFQDPAFLDFAGPEGTIYRFDENGAEIPYFVNSSVTARVQQGATLRMNSNPSLTSHATVELRGGAIDGPGLFKNLGTFRWSSGRLDAASIHGNDVMTLDQAHVHILSGGKKSLGGAFLLIRGLVEQSDSLELGQGTLILVGATSPISGSEEALAWNIVSSANITATDTSAKFENRGTVAAVASDEGVIAEIAVTFDNAEGTVLAKSKTDQNGSRAAVLRFSGKLLNLSEDGSTLTGGTWIAEGASARIEFPNASVKTIGPGATVRGSKTQTPWLGEVSRNEGDLSCQGDCAVAPKFTNAGKFVLAAVGEASAIAEAAAGIVNEKEADSDSAIDDSDGVTPLAEPIPIAGEGPFLVNNGFHVGGEGFVNAGRVRPGGASGPTGIFPVVGAYTQTETGATEIELGGTEIGEFDRLFVDGPVSLDGALRVSLVGEFAPTLGQRFPVVVYGARSGEFASYDLPDLGDSNQVWQVSYGFAAMNLSVRPGSSDLDGDGLMSAADLDALSAAVHDGQFEPLFDLNADGVLDGEDRRVWVEDLAGSLLGDADLDGDVQLDDFNLLKTHFGAAGGWGQGDFDGDGVVALADFSVLKEHFGAAAAVPEPSTLAMSALVACWAATRLRRRDGR